MRWISSMYSIGGAGGGDGPQTFKQKETLSEPEVLVIISLYLKGQLPLWETQSLY